MQRLVFSEAKIKDAAIARGTGTERRTSMPQAKPIVFVVDDDISVRESLEALLHLEGWEPQTYRSAEEFLARPRSRVPSCLILDVNLPNLNGLELQNRIAACRDET